MRVLDNLKIAIRKLGDIGEFELQDSLLCAYAAITDAENPRVDLTYSALMRVIRKENPGLVKDFEKTFQETFYEALDNNLSNPEEAALMQTIKELNLEV